MEHQSLDSIPIRRPPIRTENIYDGLIYPIIIASITFIIGSIFLKETKQVRIRDEVS